MTSLWRNVSVNVVANSNWNCLLISPQSSLKNATDSCQTERQIRPDAWDSARIACVSQQCLHENCRQMLEKEQWPSNNSPNLNGMEIWCLRSDARSYFWDLHPRPRTVSELKIALEKILDIFPQVRLIKLSQVLQVVWQEYVNGDGRHSKHLSLLKQEAQLMLTSGSTRLIAVSRARAISDGTLT